MGLGRLIERALTPAPFVGMPTTDEVGLLGTISNAVPPSHISALAGRVAGNFDLGAVAAAPTSETATLSLSAAWRCSHIITDGIGSLNIFAYDDNEADSRVPTPRSLTDPWPMITAVEWRVMLVSSLLHFGNAYILPYDADPRTGYPRQLPIVHPSRMHVEIVNGRPVYFLDENRISSLDVLHIRGLLPPGAAVGIGIIEAQRKGISLALNMDQYQSANLGQSAVPPVVIRVNRPEISQEQAIDIQSRWVARHGYGSRLPAVLPTSMEVTPIAWSPEDAQFLESKQFMAAEICWWYGIDPRLLTLSAGGQSLTYSNIETTYVDLQRMSFMPWTSRIEAALSRVLPRHIHAKFDFSPMLRTTLQDRYQSYEVGLRAGFLTIDEVRAMENMGPISLTAPAHIPGLEGQPMTMGGKVNESLPEPTTTLEVVA
jgi:HK97 family phage portal protein